MKLYIFLILSIITLSVGCLLYYLGHSVGGGFSTNILGMIATSPLWATGILIAGVGLIMTVISIVIIISAKR